MSTQIVASIVCALIAAAASITVALISNSKTKKQCTSDVLRSHEEVIGELKKTQTQLELTQQLQRKDIEDLTREVRKHNNFAERMPAVETSINELHRELDTKIEHVHDTISLLHSNH